jgi:acetyl-CoA acetyltransferase
MSKTRAVAAITGLGFSELSRTVTAPARRLAIDAVRRAVEDAGLCKKDIDGLLINRSPVAPPEMLDLKLQDGLGLTDLRLLNHVDAEGSSAVQAIQQAALMVQAGLAKHVVCVFADVPLQPGVSAGAAFAITINLFNMPGQEAVHGLFGAVGPYALACRRHMARFGTTEAHLGAVAVSGRSWAAKNPKAFLRKPLTLDDYLASPWIVEPFRLLDCAYPVNGAVAVVVSRLNKAPEAQPAVYIHGMGQGHAGNPNRVGFEPEVATGGRIAAEGAYRMAGITARQINQVQIYDAFTYNTLVTLEDYGFCRKGEAGPFVAAGTTMPGGELPVSTGGGQLSGYYLQGMTPVSEGIIQARGHGGERQAKNDIILVTGSGGRLEYHACLILSPHKYL